MILLCFLNVFYLTLHYVYHAMRDMPAYKTHGNPPPPEKNKVRDQPPASSKTQAERLKNESARMIHRASCFLHGNPVNKRWNHRRGKKKKSSRARKHTKWDKRTYHMIFIHAHTFYLFLHFPLRFFFWVLSPFIRSIFFVFFRVFSSLLLGYSSAHFLLPGALFYTNSAVFVFNFSSCVISLAFFVFRPRQSDWPRVERLPTREE